MPYRSCYECKGKGMVSGEDQQEADEKKAREWKNKNKRKKKS